MGNQVRRRMASHQGLRHSISSLSSKQRSMSTKIRPCYFDDVFENVRSKFVFSNTTLVHTHNYNTHIHTHNYNAHIHTYNYTHTHTHTQLYHAYKHTHLQKQGEPKISEKYHGGLGKITRYGILNHESRQTSTMQIWDFVRRPLHITLNTENSEP